MTFPNGASYPIFVEPARLDRPAAAAPLGAAAAGRSGRPVRARPAGGARGLRAPDATATRSRGLEVRPSTASVRTRRTGRARGRGVRQPFRPRRRATSTGATSTRRATTGASALTATASSSASRSSGTRSSTASRRARRGPGRRACARAAGRLRAREVEARRARALAAARSAARSRAGSRRRTRCASSASRSRRASWTRAPARGTSPSATSTSLGARVRRLVVGRRRSSASDPQDRRSRSHWRDGTFDAVGAATSDTRSDTRPRREQARLHHAAGRSRAPGARGNGPQARGRSPSSSTRSSCSPTERWTTSCRRTAASAPSGAGHKAARGARFEAALARELRGLRGGAVVAHMCPIYAVLAAPLVRPLRVPLVLWFTHWRASRLLRAAERVSTAVTSVDERSFPLPSRKLHAIGHGIDLDEFPCAPPREGRGRSRLLALGRYSTAKGLDVVLARCGASPAMSGSRCTARRSRTRSALHRSELEQLVDASSALDGRVVLGDAVPRARAARPASRATTRSSTTCAPGLRTRSCTRPLPDACRCSPPTRSSTRSSTAEQRFPRFDPRALADRIEAVAATSADGARGASGTACVRRSRRATRCRRGRAASSTRRGSRDATASSCTRRRSPGISGSEAHLLQLLPDLRARGWDVRFLMLHEDEPGAWEFAEELAAAASRSRTIRLRADVDPIAFGEVVGVPRATARPRILHTHLVHADVYGQLAGVARSRAAPALDEARLQRVPGRALVRARRPYGRLARARPHRDLAGARAVPRRDRGVRGGGLRDRPLRDRRRRASARRTRATSRGCSASDA